MKSKKAQVCPNRWSHPQETAASVPQETEGRVEILNCVGFLLATLGVWCVVIKFDRNVRLIVLLIRIRINGSHLHCTYA